MYEVLYLGDMMTPEQDLFDEEGSEIRWKA